MNSLTPYRDLILLQMGTRAGLRRSRQLALLFMRTMIRDAALANVDNAPAEVGSIFRRVIVFSILSVLF